MIGLTHDATEYTHNKTGFTRNTIGLIHDRKGQTDNMMDGETIQTVFTVNPINAC